VSNCIKAFWSSRKKTFSGTQPTFLPSSACLVCLAALLRFRAFELYQQVRASGKVSYS
jgi:hypothetical protein